MSSKRVPSEYHSLTPYIMADDVHGLIDFLIEAFDARVIAKLVRPDDSVAHAEVEIGDSRLMIGQTSRAFGAASASLLLYFEDCDAAFAKAAAAGGTVLFEPTDMVRSGERYGGLRDDFGNLWWIASRIEELSWEEQARRIAERSAPGLDSD